MHIHLPVSMGSLRPWQNWGGELSPGHEQELWGKASTFDVEIDSWEEQLRQFQHLLNCVVSLAWLSASDPATSLSISMKPPIYIHRFQSLATKLSNLYEKAGCQNHEDPDRMENTSTKEVSNSHQSIWVISFHTTWHRTTHYDPAITLPGRQQAELLLTSAVCNCTRSLGLVTSSLCLRNSGEVLAKGEREELGRKWICFKFQHVQCSHHLTPTDWRQAPSHWRLPHSLGCAAHGIISKSSNHFLKGDLAATVSKNRGDLGFRVEVRRQDSKRS